MKKITVNALYKYYRYPISADFKKYIEEDIHATLELSELDFVDCFNLKAMFAIRRVLMLIASGEEEVSKRNTDIVIREALMRIDYFLSMLPRENIEKDFSLALEKMK